MLRVGAGSSSGRPGAPSRAAGRRRPRPRPGHGLRDRPAPDDAAVPGGHRALGRRRGRLGDGGPRGCSTSGCGSGILAIAAGAARRGTVPRPRHRPDRGRGDRSPTPPRTASHAGSASGGARCRAASRRSTSSSPTSSRRCCVGRCAEALGRAERPAGRRGCSRRASSSTASRRSRRPSSRPGCGRRARPRKGIGSRSTRDPRRRRRALTAAPGRRCYDRPDAVLPIILAIHICLAISLFLPRSSCRSRCGPASRPTARPVGSSRRSSGSRRTGRSSSASGWRSPASLLVVVARDAGSSSSPGCWSRWRSTPSTCVLAFFDPAARTCGGSSARRVDAPTTKERWRDPGAPAALRDLRDGAPRSGSSAGS